jgi:phosphoadenosine phosphosulfate reductase
MARSEAQEVADVKKALRGAVSKTGVFSAMKLVHFALTKHGERLAVAWSGGRCSTAVLRMALDIKPDVKVIFNDTGVEYLQTVEFVKRLANEWDLNLIVARPTITFWEVAKKYGFPHQSRTGRGKPACCRLLKEYPLRSAVREQEIEGLLTGLRAVESRYRMFWTEQVGQFYFVKKYGLNVWKYNPIAFWTTKQLEKFESERGLPINPIYEKYGLERSGCWVCVGYKGWEEVMARTNPNLLAKMKELMGQGILDHYFRTQVIPCQERG